MRNSTMILVILLLVGASLVERRSGGMRSRLLGLPGAHTIQQSSYPVPDTPETRQIDTEMRDTDRRIKAVESAIRSLASNESAIENLVRQAERDRKKALHEISDATLREIYEKNRNDLQRQFIEVRTEKARLVAYRDQLKAQRINLKSRLDLARITDSYGPRDRRIEEEYAKPSPLESMDKQDASDGGGSCRRSSKDGWKSVVRTIIVR